MNNHLVSVASTGLNDWGNDDKGGRASCLEQLPCCGSTVCASTRDGMQSTATLDWVRDRTISFLLCGTKAMKGCYSMRKRKPIFFFYAQAAEVMVASPPAVQKRKTRPPLALLSESTILRRCCDGTNFAKTSRQACVPDASSPPPHHP